MQNIIYYQSILKQAENPPAPVIQSIPKDEALALILIFFLHMPPMFECFSIFSFLAQQLILPKLENTIDCTQI
jgi:hypothetical protein